MQSPTSHSNPSDSVACQHFVQLSSWHFLSCRCSSASAPLTFGVGYLGTLLWCDKHARCVLNKDAECWGCSVFNVFSASLSLAISVDVQQREGHRVQTIRSNQESALLYATSSSLLWNPQMCKNVPTSLDLWHLVTLAAAVIRLEHINSSLARCVFHLNWNHSIELITHTFFHQSWSLANSSLPEL